MRIETFGQLMSNLDDLLWAAKENARLDGPEDMATLEFVLSWFETNRDDVIDWFNGTFPPPKDENEILTECCGRPTTYLDDGDGHWVLCCRNCKREVYLNGEIK